MNIYKNYSVKINQAVNEAMAANDRQQIMRAMRRVDRAWSSFCNDSDAATQEQRDMAHYKYLGMLDYLRQAYQAKQH